MILDVSVAQTTGITVEPKYLYDANDNRLISKSSNNEIVTVYNKKGQKLLEIKGNKYIEYYYFENLLIAKKENGKLCYYHYDLFNNIVFISDENQNIRLEEIDFVNDAISKIMRN